MLKLLFDVSKNKWYNENGISYGANGPYIPFGNREKVQIQLYQKVTSANTQNPNVQEWEKYTGFYGGGYGARLSCDNNYLSKIKTNLVGNISANTNIQFIEIKTDKNASEFALSGTLDLFTGDQITDTVYYSSRNQTDSGTVLFFCNNAKTVNSYNEEAQIDAPEMMYFQAEMIPEDSEPDSGLFTFNVVCDSVKLRKKMRYESIAKLKSPSDIAALELTVFRVDENGATYIVNRFYNKDFSITGGIADIDVPVELPEEQVNAVLENLVALNANGFEIQYSNDMKEWFDYNSEIDLASGYIAFRFRLKSAGGAWSSPVPVMKGTNPHVGDNGNWFVGSEDTGITAVGQNGTTPHIGDNNNWFIGEKDTGIKAVGKDGQKGETGTSITKVEQTTTSTESGGTNAITVTLSDGTQQTFNIWNGGQGGKGDKGEKGETGESFHFDAIGNLADKEQYNDAAKGFAFLDTENGNIYIKNSETSADWTAPIPFRGEQGVSITKVEQTTTSTASEGTNVITVTLSNGQIFTFNVKNGSAGKNGEKGDKGDPGVQGPSGINGITPYIGENKNWWIGENDTGVLAEGSNQFTNGIPPFEFTNADLSNGILSKTFAELGVDSAVPVSVNIISGDGVIMDGDVRLAMIWTSNGLKVDLTQFGSITGTWKLVFAGGTKITGNGGDSGNGYTRTTVSGNTALESGHWYVCTVSGIVLTLPAGNIGDYIRISTDYQTSNVVVMPTNGETIDGDSEGFTLDKTSGTVEFFWTDSEWTVIEAK